MFLLGASAELFADGAHFRRKVGQEGGYSVEGLLADVGVAGRDVLGAGGSGSVQEREPLHVVKLNMGDGRT